jgi:glutathione S-transferase
LCYFSFKIVYVEREEAEKDPKKNVFNCVQRAHQNSLEVLPLFSTLLLVGGLKYPEISAGAGLLFLLGRMVYASGYSTGIPSKRNRGAFGYLGLLTLLGTSVMTVYNLVKN